MKSPGCRQNQIAKIIGKDKSIVTRELKRFAVVVYRISFKGELFK